MSLEKTFCMVCGTQIQDRICTACGFEITEDEKQEGIRFVTGWQIDPKKITGVGGT